MKQARGTRIGHRGFTLIEMTIVLIVMAILFSFISFRGITGDNELIAQVEILKSHLRHAQLKAMNDTVSWGIHIPGANSYILYRDNAVANDMLPGEQPGASPAPQTHTLPTSMLITAGVGATVNFNSWGSPVDTAGAVLSAPQTITISRGAASGSVTIIQNTGYIQ